MNIFLYILSLEPSIGAELNRAIICFDQRKTSMLGPLARVLFVILSAGEDLREDKLRKGIADHDPANEIEHSLGYFNGCFLLFRGLLMDEELVEDWSSQIYQERSFNWKSSQIQLQGCTNTFRNLPAALRQAQPDGS